VLARYKELGFPAVAGQPELARRAFVIGIDSAPDAHQTRPPQGPPLSATPKLKSSLFEGAESPAEPGLNPLSIRALCARGVLIGVTTRDEDSFINQ
jgi:hypothetical protein